MSEATRLQSKDKSCYQSHKDISTSETSIKQVSGSFTLRKGPRAMTCIKGSFGIGSHNKASEHIVLLLLKKDAYVSPLASRKLLRPQNHQ